ncbi:MAG: HD domain-containing protein [Planctomycetota bacterium]
MAPPKRFSVLRDPVHGDVYLTHEEIAVLDTAAMQRLRGIKQLGTAYVAYPGALHTRFDHSIGTLHMTQAMVEAIQRNYELDPRGSLGIPEDEARVIRLAALVHDVTHIPFGHNIEDQTGLFHRHDSAYRYQRALDPKTELGGLLDELGARGDVLKTLLDAPGESHGVPPYWSQVISDTLCSDILDYLQRDAYFTGLKLGIDPRVTNYFRIDRKSSNLFVDLAKRDLLREDILSEIVRLLEARYYFSERVYYHHAKVAAGALLARAVELAVVHDLVVEADFYDLEDASLLELLSNRADRARADGRADVAQRIHSLVDRFRRRRLLKRAAVFPRYANKAVQERLVAEFFSAEAHKQRAAAEARVMDVVRFATGREVEVIFYCPAARMQLKEAQTHVRWPGEADVRPLAHFAERVPRLADLERAYRDLWKFYVFADTSDPAILAKVQAASLAEFPGATNVYRIDVAD